MTISDNGDMELVLATVVAITCYFLQENRETNVFLTDSTPARTRLYQIIINKYLDQIRLISKSLHTERVVGSDLKKNVNYEFFTVSKLF